jgi:hypothetical protein
MEVIFKVIFPTIPFTVHTYNLLPCPISPAVIQRKSINLLALNAIGVTEI